MIKYYFFLALSFFCFSNIFPISPITQIPNHKLNKLQENKLQEKYIVVIIPSFNNERCVEKNLSSIYRQNYTNYKVIYIDDCSTDNTYQKVVNFINKNGVSQRTTIITNKQRIGALANLYTTIHSCPDDAIIVHVDGDDSLADENVLSYINNIYSTKDIWFTYGSKIWNGRQWKGKIWPLAPYPENVINTCSFREYGWQMDHLRTHYAWIFKLITLNDLMYHGQFFKIMGDAAFLFPLIEMASKGHFAFINKILYLYNTDNALSDFAGNGYLDQALVCDYIRAKKPYSALAQKVSCEQLTDNDKADIIFFTHKLPESLPRITNIISRAITRTIDRCGTIYLIDLNDSMKTGSQVIKILSNNTCNYVLFITDKSLQNLPRLTHPISKMIYHLKKTAAQCFFLSAWQQIHNKYIPMDRAPINIEHTIIARQFCGDEQSQYPIQAFDGVLWNKNYIKQALSHKHALNQDDLRNIAHKACYADQAICLMYDNFKKSPQIIPDIVGFTSHSNQISPLVNAIKKKIKFFKKIWIINKSDPTFVVYDCSYKKERQYMQQSKNICALLNTIIKNGCAQSLLFVTNYFSYYPGPIALDKSAQALVFYPTVSTFFLDIRGQDLLHNLHCISQQASLIDDTTFKCVYQSNVSPNNYLPTIDTTLWRTNDCRIAIDGKFASCIEDLREILDNYCLSSHRECLWFFDPKFNAIKNNSIIIISRSKLENKTLTQKIQSADLCSHNFNINTIDLSDKDSLHKKNLQQTILDIINQCNNDYINFLTYDIIMRNDTFYFDDRIVRLMQNNFCSAALLPLKNPPLKTFNLPVWVDLFGYYKHEKLYVVNADTIPTNSIPTIDGTIWYKNDLAAAIQNSSFNNERELRKTLKSYLTHNKKLKIII